MLAGELRVHEEMIAETDDLTPVGSFEGVGVAMDCLYRCLELEWAERVASDTRSDDCMPLFDHVAIPPRAVLVMQQHDCTVKCGGGCRWLCCLWAGAPRLWNAVDTQFAIASGGKGLTALATVSLIVEGTLSLDTTARSVLGADPSADSR
jgi:hypothetical protein